MTAPSTKPRGGSNSLLLNVPHRARGRTETYRHVALFANGRSLRVDLRYEHFVGRILRRNRGSDLRELSENILRETPKRTEAGATIYRDSL